MLIRALRGFHRASAGELMVRPSLERGRSSPTACSFPASHLGPWNWDTKQHFLALIYIIYVHRTAYQTIDFIVDQSFFLFFSPFCASCALIVPCTFFFLYFSFILFILFYLYLYDYLIRFFPFWSVSLLKATILFDFAEKCKLSPRPVPGMQKVFCKYLWNKWTDDWLLS